jgi:hypothetical protein
MEVSRVNSLSCAADSPLSREDGCAVRDEGQNRGALVGETSPGDDTGSWTLWSEHPSSCDKAEPSVRWSMPTSRATTRNTGSHYSPRTSATSTPKPPTGICRRRLSSCTWLAIVLNVISEARRECARPDAPNVFHRATHPPASSQSAYARGVPRYDAVTRPIRDGAPRCRTVEAGDQRPRCHAEQRLSRSSRTRLPE